jgi:hypothetical protein
MAYPALRSMNKDLEEGMSDGKYKKICPNRGGDVEKELLYSGRVDLSDTYFGIHEITAKSLPDGTVDEHSSLFVPNVPPAGSSGTPI